VTQHLARINKILYIKGSFRLQKAPKLFLFLAGALPRTPPGELRRSPDLLVEWGRECPLHIPLPHLGIQRLDTYDYLTTLDVATTSIRRVTIPKFETACPHRDSTTDQFAGAAAAAQMGSHA